MLFLSSRFVGRGLKELSKTWMKDLALTSAGAQEGPTHRAESRWAHGDFVPLGSPCCHSGAKVTCRSAW